MLKTEQKNKIKSVISADITDLHIDIEDLEEMTQPIAPDDSYGRVSRMDAINNKSTNEESLRMKKRRLNKLEKALRNLDNNSFGICSSCKKEIPFERLIYIPETETCTECSK